MIQGKVSGFEKLIETVMNGLGRERCSQCGGRVRVECFHPPVFVRDGVSGLRRRCLECGHVEIVWCR